MIFSCRGCVAAALSTLRGGMHSCKEHTDVIYVPGVQDIPSGSCCEYTEGEARKTKRPRSTDIISSCSIYLPGS